MTTARRKQQFAFVALLLALFWCVVGSGCRSVSQEVSDSRVQDTQLSHDHTSAAAVVEGRVITQDDIHAYLQSFRLRNDLIGEESWATYLKERGYTQDDIRALALRELVDNALVEVEAERLGVAVDDAEVLMLIGRLSSRYPSHAAWEAALTANGYNDTSYREVVRAQLLSDAVKDAVIPDASPTEEQVAEYAVVVAPTLIGRRSSQVLISATDEELAQYVHQLAVAGQDFAELARTYSIDISAAHNGDMGWDCVNVYSLQYQQALDALDVGEISPVVRSSFGYHIILCTDYYTAPLDANGAVDVDAIPKELMDEIRASIMSTLKQQTFKVYIRNLEAKATLAVFDDHGVQIDPTQMGFADEVIDIVAAETDSYTGVPFAPDESPSLDTPVELLETSAALEASPR